MAPGLPSSNARRASRIRIESFAPIARPDAEVLILGSMPGVASLAAGRYYAHPHNAFWRIMTDLLELDAGATYETRLDALVEARIAVWDVLRSCHRVGSLDSSIVRETQEPNDFATFFRDHPNIRRVLCNGTKSHETFRRCVPGDAIRPAVEILRLPSTSPANASWPYAKKLEAWRGALSDVLPQVARRRRPARRSTRA